MLWVDPATACYGLTLLLTLLQGSLGGITVTTNLVIRSDQDWQAFSKVHEGNGFGLAMKALVTMAARERCRSIPFRSEGEGPIDIVEVLLMDGAVTEVGHSSNSFAMSRPHRYG